ncbi:MAG: NAD+ synthase [Candidatus Aenigmarchaeota archaeon]|nr:NAD+ synthase [Candidatus Aenigmarchaeota archaeon]
MAKGMNEVKDRIVEWLKGKVEEAGAKGAVIGLSGGVDSSLVAALAKKALGENVIGVIMPCGSADQDADHAMELAEGFGIRTEFVDIKPIFDRLRQSLPPGQGIAEANLKPRLRMVTLYYFANLNNYLVLGTGNKSELMVGYYTKYGDGGVDLLPIAGLYKSEVREMARMIGVPEGIIAKPPSAGLWHGQTDEGEIGMSYDELDETLKAIERHETGGIDPARLEKVSKMLKKTGHKREMPAIFEP